MQVAQPATGGRAAVAGGSQPIEHDQFEAGFADSVIDRVIGYRDLAELVVAVERDITASRAMSSRPLNTPLRSSPSVITPQPSSRSSMTMDILPRSG
jgi:hypothetical protein